MFKDAAHSKIFKRKGFVSFPLLSVAEIEAARDIYAAFEQTHHGPEDKFKGTGWVQQPEVVNSVDSKLHALLSGALQRQFINYQTLGFGFLLKEYGTDSAVPPHQDWTYVDEERFYSMNVWIALEDTDISNGCLYFIPRSHRIGKYLRPSPSYPVPYQSIADYVATFKVAVPLKAGDCVCFNNKTIHGSYPNMSDNFRLAAVTTLYPAEAELIHHYVHDETQPQKITEYVITKNTFMNLKRGLPPAQYSRESKTETAYPVFTKLAFGFQMQKLKLADALSM